MPSGWLYTFKDNDTGQVLPGALESVTPDIGSNDLMTVVMEVSPPAEREAQNIGLVELQISSTGDADLRTEIAFTVHRTFGILAEVISDSDGGILGSVGPVAPESTMNYNIRISDTSDIAGQTTWRLVNPKDLQTNKDADMGYSNWDYKIKNGTETDVIVVTLDPGSYADVELEITLPENVEAGNHTVYFRVSEEGVDSSDKPRFFDLPIVVRVLEDVQPGRLPITQRVNLPDSHLKKVRILSLEFPMITTYRSQ